MGVRYCDQPGAGRKKNICGARNSPAKMFPSDRPTVRSMSSGVRTSRWRTRSPKPGKNDSSVAWTVSPRPAFWVSQSLSRRWYGAYWTKQLITALPGGAARGAGRGERGGGGWGAVGGGAPRRPAVLRDGRFDRRPGPDPRADRPRRAREALGDPAVAALVERPGAELAVVLAHEVVE